MPDDTVTATPTTPPTDTQPTVDTSLPPGFSLYQPALKKGTHRLLCTVQDFGPSVKQQDDGSTTFQGWSITPVLAQEAPDDSGGKLPVGTRLPRMTIWTTVSQFRDQENALKQAVGALMALNNIPVNNRNRQSCDAAAAAFAALEPYKRLPLADKPDTDAAHYEQWKNGQVVVVVQVKDDAKTGETRTNCLGLEAASTAKS